MSEKQLVVAALLVALSSMATACSTPRLYSPSGRVAPLEAARTVGEDQRAMGVYGGPTTVGELDITHVSARFRHGVTEHVEVGVDGNLGVLTNMAEAATPTDPTLWSVRLATKWAPEVLQDYFAVIGGVAGGTYTGGEFISPDLGVVLAFENPYVVPFLSASGYVSVPVGAREVDVSISDPGDSIVTPKTTWGLTTTAGVRVPIALRDWTLAPSVGYARTDLTDGDQNDVGNAVNIGVDMIF